MGKSIDTSFGRAFDSVLPAITFGILLFCVAADVGLRSVRHVTERFRLGAFRGASEERLGFRCADKKRGADVSAGTHVVLKTVEAEGVLGRAGLKGGDVVVGVESVDAFTRVLMTRQGEVVALEVRRRVGPALAGVEHSLHTTFMMPVILVTTGSEGADRGVRGSCDVEKAKHTAR